MGRRKQKYYKGIIPRIFRTLWACVQWMWLHPQPVLVVGVLAILCFAVSSFALKAEAFRIMRVELPAESTLRLPEPLEGKNIWQVDIQKLSQKLQQQQPWLQQVRVVRYLPDTLIIEPVLRTPFALIQLDHWYVVDRYGYIIPVDGSNPDTSLTHLVGFRQAQAALKVGRVNRAEPLQRALRVLDILQQSSILAGNRIHELDVSDPDLIRFVIENSTEIRCGSEAQLTAHLERLSSTLAVIDTQDMNLLYIDVRFADPVVAPRT